MGIQTLELHMSYRGRTLGPIRPMCYKIICGLLSTCMLKIF